LKWSIYQIRYGYHDMKHKKQLATDGLPMQYRNNLLIDNGSSLGLR